MAASPRASACSRRSDGVIRACRSRSSARSRLMRSPTTRLYPGPRRAQDQGPGARARGAKAPVFQPLESRAGADAELLYRRRGEASANRTHRPRQRGHLQSREPWSGSVMHSSERPSVWAVGAVGNAQRFPSRCGRAVRCSSSTTAAASTVPVSRARAGGGTGRWTPRFLRRRLVPERVTPSARRAPRGRDRLGIGGTR